MQCLICGLADLVDGLTSVALERDETKFLITRVPAHLCPACGEAYLDEDIAVHLLNKAEQLSLSGLIHAEMDF